MEVQTQTDGKTDRKIDNLTDGQTIWKQTSMCKYKLMERQTDGQVDK
jgi:hypothetical protein